MYRKLNEHTCERPSISVLLLIRGNSGKTSPLSLLNDTHHPPPNAECRRLIPSATNGFVALDDILIAWRRHSRSCPPLQVKALLKKRCDCGEHHSVLNQRAVRGGIA